VYASPEYVSTLDKVNPIAAHVKVDFELWGCPVSGRQIVGALRALLFGVVPAQEEDKVCLECKRQLTVCVMVAKGVPCMGPVTRTGCGAICPAFGRDCYACYGPAENPNTAAQARRLAGLGLPPREVAARFEFINNAAPAFRDAAAQVGKA
jgi:coenzyme F420-reducing hydrogenase gamma subunit